MINPDIRDQAYQFFIEEAPELLQAIEAGLLTLKQERTTAKVHELMRAAHSIKGGAASVELGAIKTLAHRLEDIFKALYGEEVEIDTDLENLLLQAYDCLKEPLMEQISTGEFDSEAALATANPVFAQIEAQLGDALNQADDYIPSSADLGIDIVSSIFDVDVAQGLERLSAVVANPQEYEIAGELRAQAEVFSGFAELLNLPGFGAIAQTALAALELHPEQVLSITQLALADFQSARQAVLEGDRAQGGSPSEALVALTEATSAANEPDLSVLDDNHGFDSSSLESPWDVETATQAQESEFISEIEESEIETLPLDDVFGSTGDNPEMDVLESVALDGTEVETPSLDDVFSSAGDNPEMEVLESVALENTETETPSLDDVFGSAGDNPEMDVLESVAPEGTEVEIPSLDNVFGSAGDSPEMDVLESVALEDTETETPPLEDVFSSAGDSPEMDVLESVALEDTETETPPLEDVFSSAEDSPETEALLEIEAQETPENLEAAVQSVEQIFEQLPSVQNIPVPHFPSKSQVESKVQAKDRLNQKSDRQRGATPTANLSVRVDFNRLERMNNLVGELAINRNSLSLQNDQLQGTVRELLNRFVRFQEMTGNLRELSDQMLIAPMNSQVSDLPRAPRLEASEDGKIQNLADFDSLEMDSYGTLHSLLQELLEEMMQLSEAVDDVVLFARQSDQSLEQQRQMLTNLRSELMWARMLPLGEVLNRFPRILRDLCVTYHKSVRLKLTGTGVLVDKAILEKLYDPLLHLLRNAFDHGIESPELRRQQGKPEEGKIEIRAYYQGNQTIIEMKDDGAGLNLEKIGRRAIKLGLLSSEQLAVTPKERLLDAIFEPGFSTASQVSELSGRGIGLDVVRSQLRSLKGTVAVTSSPGQGTTFTLRLPLTLTISKLLVCLMGSAAFALPSDSIEEIIIPQADQIKQSGKQRFLHWHQQIIPVYPLLDLLDYRCPLSETLPSKALVAVPSPEDWALPLLLLRRGQQVFALEVERLVTEQELVIKPFGAAISPPNYTYGCTILGDGSLIPVINGAILVEQFLEPSAAATRTMTGSRAAGQSDSQTAPITAGVPTVLVVDDSAALRRTLALTLQKAGYRVLQASDGKQALEQLQQSSRVQLVICDVEMPNMNGFEFLSQRRQNPQLAQIPVAMLTSRSSNKHRQLAMHLGANAYFTKPYIEQEFLGALKKILAQSSPENLVHNS